MNKTVLPVLYSLPVTERLALPPRAEILPRIESGELDHLDFDAKVYKSGPNRNFFTFAPADLPAFAASFEGQPFLRNHDTHDIAARDGTILTSKVENDWFIQTVRLTTRAGMTAFVEGQIDRFSIGWFYDNILCTICHTSWFNCQHWPGQEYETEKGKQTCELLFTNPKGKETSAVNANAVEGSSILAQLQAYKVVAQSATKSEIAGDTSESQTCPDAEIMVAQSATNVVAQSATNVVAQSATIHLPAAAQVGAPHTMGLPSTRTQSPKEDLMPTPEEPVGEQTPVNPNVSTGSTTAVSTGSTTTVPTGSITMIEQIEANRLAALEANRLTSAQLDESTAILIAQCEHLLTSSLSTSRLPDVVQKRIRKSFEGKAFKATDLFAAINEAREEVGALTAGSLIKGPIRIHDMTSNADQLQVAVDDMFGIPRDPALAAIKPAHLSGIRELYLTLTGDYELRGGYYPEAALAITTDFTGLVKNALNKVVAQQWDLLGKAGYDWWEKIVKVEHFNSLNDITGILMGTVGTLPAVAERGEYTELVIGDSPETAAFNKYGGYIPLTLELIDRDETRKLKAYPVELANASLRRLSGLIAAVFSANAGVGPTMADTGALFNATAVTTAGGHANLLTTALSAAQWEVIGAAVYNQPLLIKNATGYYGTGSKMGVDPRFMLVPRGLRLTAMKILYPALENLSNIYSENLQQGKPGDVIVVPEWTDATDWAAVVDPIIAPAIIVGERFGLKPEIYVANRELDPAVFMNDEHRIKVRMFNAVLVQDFRPLHKSNVAG